MRWQYNEFVFDLITNVNTLKLTFIIVVGFSVGYYVLPVIITHVVKHT